MKGKDEIKELFQKELGNYQAKVDPKLWNGIQAGLGSTSAAAGIGSSLGLAGKIIIGASLAAAITVGTILIVNNNASTQENKKPFNEAGTNDWVKEENAIQPERKENKSEDTSISEAKTKDVTNEIEYTNSAEKNSNQQDNNGSTDVLFEKSVGNSEKIYAYEEEKNTSSEKANIVQTKPDVAPAIEIIADQNLYQNKVDLSKVKIEIIKQNNQYVNFSAVNVPSDRQITWNFGDGNFERSLNPEHFYAEAGIYNVVLTVQSGKEEITKNINVNIQLKGEIGDLPNVFTPNGDGRNDELFIECKYLKSFQLTVMDNNQNILFSTNDTNFRWSGIDKNGTPVKEGNYVYMIVAEDEAGNTINKYQHLRIQR